MARWTILYATAAAIWLAGGCGPTGQTRSEAFPLPPIDQEIEAGRAAAPLLERQCGGRLHDLAVQAYVRSVGERLARSTAVGHFPYQFAVLDSEAVAAVALPGGPVFITRGLLERLASEGELAAVLGHLLAHINCRHACREVLISLGRRSFAEAASAEQGRRRGQPPTRRAAECAARLAEVATTLRFTPDEESEADRLGLDYLAAAGYNPDQMLRFLEVMSSPAATDGLARMHPDPPDRSDAIRQIIGRKYSGRAGRVAEDEYRRQVLERLKERGSWAGEEASGAPPS